MILSRMGIITQRCWLDIPKHFKGVVLDYFMVMPNHIHGIVVINNHDDVGQCVETLHCNVSTTAVNHHMSHISPKSQSLPIVIRSFKSITSRIIHDMGDHGFQWQPRFYDHVITNNHDLYRVRKYIMNNPLMWERDRNYG